MRLRSTSCLRRRGRRFIVKLDAKSGHRFILCRLSTATPDPDPLAYLKQAQMLDRYQHWESVGGGGYIARSSSRCGWWWLRNVPWREGLRITCLKLRGILDWIIFRNFDRRQALDRTDDSDVRKSGSCEKSTDAGIFLSYPCFVYILVHTYEAFHIWSLIFIRIITS